MDRFIVEGNILGLIIVYVKNVGGSGVVMLNGIEFIIVNGDEFLVDVFR